MNLIAFGNNGPYPKADGACSGYLVHNDNCKIIFDIGSSTLPKLLKRIDPSELDAIIISHWHADHCSDLFALEYYFQLNLEENKKIKLYSVKDEVSPFYQAITKSQYFECIEIDENSNFKIKNINISAQKAKHPVKALMFKIECDGKILIYSGDTNYFDGIEEFCKNADVFICDAAFDHKNWNENKPHLSAKLAGEIARKADVKKLLLTHISPLRAESIILNEAREYFKNLEIIKTESNYIV